MRLPIAASLLLLGLATVPNAQAADLGLADLALCESVSGDWDRDGESEPWSVCATPPCGCACPVVGAGVVVEAADQERGAWVATSGCQTGFATMGDEADGDQTVRPFVWTWGLPPIEMG